MTSKFEQVRKDGIEVAINKHTCRRVLALPIGTSDNLELWEEISPSTVSLLGTYTSSLIPCSLKDD